MHCFKLLGQRVASRTLERQITELKVRAAVLNRFSQIGTPTTIRVAERSLVMTTSCSARIMQQSLLLSQAA